MKYDTVEQAIEDLKLDRRHKWYSFMGILIYSHKYRYKCSGCDGGGCHECGYKGMRINHVPVAALNANGDTVTIKTASPEGKQGESR